MPLLNKDPLATFEKWTRYVPNEDLGALLKNYMLESNHNNWDGWNRRDLTGIRHMCEDMMRYFLKEGDHTS